jgi:hypothetical protein
MPLTDAEGRACGAAVCPDAGTGGRSSHASFRAPMASATTRTPTPRVKVTPSPSNGSRSGPEVSREDAFLEALQDVPRCTVSGPFRCLGGEDDGLRDDGRPQLRHQVVGMRRRPAPRTPTRRPLTGVRHMRSLIGMFQGATF